MPIYGKKHLNIFFSRTKKALRLNFGMLHLGLKIYQVCSNDHPRLTFDLFMTRSKLRPRAFVQGKYWKKNNNNNKKKKTTDFIQTFEKSFSQNVLKTNGWYLQGMIQIVKNFSFNQNVVRWGLSALASGPCRIFQWLFLWPVLPHFCKRGMVILFKWFCTFEQDGHHDAISEKNFIYSIGSQGLPSLFKWCPRMTFYLMTAQSNFCPVCGGNTGRICMPYANM